MIKVEMTVTGAEKNAQGLRAVKQGVVDEIQVETHESGYFLHTELATYGPPREGSDYVRTYNYQRAIKVEPKNQSWGAELTAAQNYGAATFLRGDLAGRGPAWMHRPRWKTLVAILESFLNGFVNRLIKRLERLIRRGMG